jgi:hypothetical protein
MTVTAVGLTPRRWFAFGLLVLLTGCAGEFSGPPPPSQAEQLCKSWGYEPDDPVCLNTFRRDPPNH